MQAGAKTAYLIDKPMAAAIGAKVAVSSTDGIVVVNVGAGSTEMAVIVLGEIVAIQSIPTGGDALDRAIEAFIARTQADELMLTAQIFDHAARLYSFEIAARAAAKP